jgi:hypothetical protein
MAIPNTSITVNSGGLGITTPGVGGTPAIFGWASQGPAGVLVTVGSGNVTQLSSTYGVGNMVDLAASVLSNGAGSVVCCRMYHGTMGTFSHTGSGSPSVPTSAPTQSGGGPVAPFGIATATGSTGPIFLITTGGALGTMAFEYSLDGGNTWTAPVASVSGGIFIVPNTGITVTFAAGTYVANDTYTSAITTAVGSSGTVVQAAANGGTGAGEGLVSADASNNPQDNYNVVVLIAASGVLGVGQYSYSLDGGLTYSSNILIPSSGPSNLGNGILIDWANTGGAGATSGFIVGDTYKFTTAGPAYTPGDVTQVTTNLAGTTVAFDWAHFTAVPTSIASSTALFGVLSTQMSLWFSNSLFSFAVMQTPPDTTQNNIDQALITAYTNLASDLVSVGAGDCAITSPLSGANVERNAAWAATIRGATTNVGIDLAAVQLGNLPFIAQLFRDEQQTPALDAARFTTLRTIQQYTGFFLTNARIFSNPNTSNIVYWQHRRLLNLICRLAYKALTYFLSSPVRVNSTTGTIFQADATAIQNYVTNAIAPQTTQANQCSGLSVIVNTSNDILTTQQLLVTVGCIPNAYPKFIQATIGFVNPALSTPQ